jgi:hypothetical protein
MSLSDDERNRCIDFLQIAREEYNNNNPQIAKDFIASVEEMLLGGDSQLQECAELLQQTRANMNTDAETLLEDIEYVTGFLNE